MKYGLNSNGMHKNNRTLVFKTLLQNGEITRTELAKRLGLQKATITNIINEFFDMRIVKIVGQEASGRRGEKLCLVLDGMYTMSIGITRSDYQVAIFTLSGEEVSNIRFRFEREKNFRETIEHLKEDIALQIERYGEQRIFGICMAVPGLYMRDRIENKEIYMISEFEQWSEVDIRKELETVTKRPIEIVYDAKLAAYAEWRNAAEVKNDENASLAVVRSRGFGIGAGFVINGRLVEGCLGIAGEVGHMGINYLTQKKQSGTFEACAGTDSAIQYMLQRMYEFPDSLLNENSTYADIVEQYQKKDPLAVWTIEKLAWMLGYGIVNIIFTLNPDYIILGADYPSDDEFIEKVKKAVYECTPAFVADNTVIRYSKLKTDSYLLGANYYLVDKLCDNNQIFDKFNAIIS